MYDLMVAFYHTTKHRKPVLLTFWGSAQKRERIRGPNHQKFSAFTCLFLSLSVFPTPPPHTGWRDLIP